MRMARKRRSLSVAGVLLALGCFAGVPACSALFDLSADQCSVDADCEKLGSGLGICDAGVCVADSGNLGGAGGKDSGQGGDEPTAGGEGGAMSVAECATNGECIDAHFGQPYICQEGQCVSLITDECPLVVGAQNLRALEPIIFGAYALAPDGVSRSVVTRNLELVVSEFTSEVIGLRGGPDGSQRTLAFVVCNSYFPDNPPGTIDAFSPSLTHLIDTVRVPGLVSGLQARDLQAVFSQKLDAAGTFVISPYEQDSELAALNDDGRLWHLLGATADIAPVFGPLLKRTEAYLRLDESFLNLPSAGAKLRLAIVTADIASETDVRDALLELPELEDFEVKLLQVESALLEEDPDVSVVTGNLFDFRPNIIVALAGSEFIDGVFPPLENGGAWSNETDEQQRPMYLLGSAMGPQTWSIYADKRHETSGGWKTFFDRIAGVAYASAEDPKLLEDYENRLIAASGDLSDPSVVLGSESVYDAAYLLIYAAAAAGEVPALRGKELATGMRRLIDGTPYDVGKKSISSILTALDNGDDIRLRLTLGEPDWNEARGTRTGVGSVYCINNGASAPERDLPLGPMRDVLRFDPATNQLAEQPLTCISNF